MSQAQGAEWPHLEVRTVCAEHGEVLAGGGATRPLQPAFHAWYTCPELPPAPRTPTLPADRQD